MTNMLNLTANDARDFYSGSKQAYKVKPIKQFAVN